MSGITDPTEEYFKDGLWGWVSTRWRKLLLNASYSLIVALEDAAHAPVGGHGYVNASWHPNPIAYGYSDICSFYVHKDNLPAGSSGIASDPCPAGWLWIVTNITIRYVGTVPTEISVHIYNNVLYTLVFAQRSPVSYVVYDRQGQWVLKAGNFIWAFVEGATLNDDLHLDVLGFKVQINL